MQRPRAGHRTGVWKSSSSDLSGTKRASARALSRGHHTQTGVNDEIGTLVSRIEGTDHDRNRWNDDGCRNVASAAPDLNMYELSDGSRWIVGCVENNQAVHLLAAEAFQSAGPVSVLCLVGYTAVHKE